MLLNNHVKQSPIVGVAGLGGGIASYIFLSAGGAYEIARSLRFDSTTGAYLSRTFGSDGTRTTWTLSFWMKRGTIGGTQMLYEADVSLNESFLYLDAGSNLQLYDGTSGGGAIVSASELRDPSAWYHIVIKYDTTIVSPSSDRVRMYVNGVDRTSSSSTPPDQDHQSPFGSATTNKIATRRTNIQFFDGYLADIWFVDGQALEPTSFGEFDEDTGVWNPKRYTGAKSGNSFHLPFSDTTSTTTLGYDDSGNNNHWTLNNIPGYYAEFISSDRLNTTGSVLSASGQVTIECHIYSRDTSPRGIFDGGANETNIIRNYSTGNVAKQGQEGTGASFTVTANKWQHFAATFNSGNIKVFIDGSLAGSGTYTGGYAAGSSFDIGTINTGGDGSFNGFIRNFRVTQSILYTTTFTPPSVSEDLTAVANTSYLVLTSGTTDQSTNGYTTTEYGIRGYSITDGSAFVDTPNNDTDTGTGIGGEIVGNYCTWNSRVGRYNDSGQSGTAPTFRNGNLDASGGQANDRIAATFSFDVGVTGKYYWEVIFKGTPASSNGAGVRDYSAGTSTQVLKFWYYDGSLVDGGPGTTFTNGDVLGFAMDLSAGTIDCYKNGGSSVGQMDISSLTSVTPFVSNNSGIIVTGNFGQRDFAYDAPTGFKALNTAALPTPAIEKGSDYVGVTTYTGNGTSQSFNIGFKPDLVWVKARSAAISNRVVDSVRGVNKDLITNGTFAEQDMGPGGFNSPSVSAFNSDGFTVGSDGAVNQNTTTYVAWTWKAGGAPTANNVATSGAMTANSVSVDGVLQSAYTPSGSPTAYPTKMSVGTTQGFSIITWTPDGSARKLPHGLGKTPKFIITKDRDNANIWIIYHASTGTQKYFRFDDQAVYSNGGTFTTAPDENIFDPGTSITSGNGYGAQVCYLWADVPGFQKFGSYTSNGNADGPFIELGFRPALVIIKSTSDPGGGVNWTIHDSERSPYNYQYRTLYANQSVAESANPAYPRLDLLSNGFKVRNTFQDYNYTGATYTYVYAAWAENPFSIARAR